MLPSSWEKNEALADRGASSKAFSRSKFLLVVSRTSNDTVATFIPDAQLERALLFCLSLVNECSNSIQ
jgi:hypothetical protein